MIMFTTYCLFKIFELSKSLKLFISQNNFFIRLFTMLSRKILFAQNHENYFYFGKNFGSETLIHPIILILHGGYGILQIEKQAQ